MNDVQQAFVKPHHPQTNEHTCQGNTECWSLILDEGLLQVDYTNCAIPITISQIKIYDAITDNVITVIVHTWNSARNKDWPQGLERIKKRYISK